MIFSCFCLFFKRFSKCWVSKSRLFYYSSKGNISLTEKYSYLSFLSHNNAYILASSLQISHCSFSYLILSSSNILSVTLVLKCKGLSDARVVLIIWGAQIGCLWIALGNQRLPVQVRLVPTCRDELSTLTVRLMPKCLWSWWKW